MTAATVAIDWHNSRTWRLTPKNTAWCLLGCVIGDFGTIAFLLFTGIPWRSWLLRSSTAW